MTSERDPSTLPTDKVPAVARQSIAPPKDLRPPTIPASRADGMGSPPRDEKKYPRARTATPEEAKAQLEALLGEDEAEWTGDRVRLRMRKHREQWSWSIHVENLLRALAVLGIRHLQLDLRTFATNDTTVLRALTTVAIPSLETLQFGLVYDPVENRMDSWFAEITAAQRGLTTTAAEAWTRAGWPRVVSHNRVTGEHFDMELEPNMGPFHALREPAPGQHPFEVPHLGFSHDPGRGVRFSATLNDSDEPLLLNGKPLPSTQMTLIDGDVVQAGPWHWSVHEKAYVAPNPHSTLLDDLRARQPAPEERLIGAWPFFRFGQGNARRLATVTLEGALLELAPDTGLAGIEQVLRLIDPRHAPPYRDLAWLVEHFAGWQAMPHFIEHVKHWLTSDGVGRSVVFVGDGAFRVQVGRRVDGPLSSEAELATFALAARGAVRLESHEADSVSAPPLFLALADRFGPDGAAALWRFRHFRREASGVSIDVAIERIDVGAFTWLRLVADGWDVDVTAVDGKAVELRRARSGSTEPVRTHWDDGLAYLTKLLRTVDRAQLSDEDVLAVVPHLGAGRLVDPTVRRTGDVLRFLTELPPGEGASHCEFTVNFRGEPSVQVRTRDSANRMKFT